MTRILNDNLTNEMYICYVHNICITLPKKLNIELILLNTNFILITLKIKLKYNFEAVCRGIVLCRVICFQLGSLAREGILG